MEQEAIYVRVYQGIYDKDGKWHPFKEPTTENIGQLLACGVAEKIDILDYFEGKAKWGSGNYMISDGVTYHGRSNFDCSG